MRPIVKGLLAELTPAWLQRLAEVQRRAHEIPSKIDAGTERSEPPVKRRQRPYQPPPPPIDDISKTL